MYAIGFDYRPGITAETGKDYKIVKLAERKFDISLDESLRVKPEVAQVLRQVADEIMEGRHDGN